MQTDKERFKVMSFYYGKASELGEEEASKLIQVFDDEVNNKWVDFERRHLPINFRAGFTYRIKPETVMHKCGEIPKPCDGIDCCYKLYSPNWDFSEDKKSIVASYDVFILNKTGDRIKSLLNAGMLHKTKEAAIAHAKVIYQIED